MSELDKLPIKEKMAVVFNGIISGMDGRDGIGQPINLVDCSKTIKYNILSTYDCDVFIHSWSTNYEKQINDIYNPVASLYQSQEYFGYIKGSNPEYLRYQRDGSITHDRNMQAEGSEFSGDDGTSIGYRTFSRYASIERGMKLKQNYELANGFRYKWVFIMRFDLVFYKKLDLSILDPEYVYICREPAWPDIHAVKLVHDPFLLSSSKLMDEFSNLFSELSSNTFGTYWPHQLAYLKLVDMAKKNNKQDIIKFIFNRFTEVEPYRQVMIPDPNNFGSWEAGSLLCKEKLIDLLKTIDQSKNE